MTFTHVVAGAARQSNDLTASPGKVAPLVVCHLQGSHSSGASLASLLQRPESGQSETAQEMHKKCTRVFEKATKTKLEKKKEEGEEPRLADQTTAKTHLESNP